MNTARDRLAEAAGSVEYATESWREEARRNVGDPDGEPSPPAAAEAARRCGVPDAVIAAAGLRACLTEMGGWPFAERVTNAIELSDAAGAELAREAWHSAKSLTCSGLLRDLNMSGVATEMSLAALYWASAARAAAAGNVCLAAYDMHCAAVSCGSGVASEAVGSSPAGRVGRAMVNAAVAWVELHATQR